MTHLYYHNIVILNIQILKWQKILRKISDKYYELKRRSYK